MVTHLGRRGSYFITDRRVVHGSKSQGGETSANVRPRSKGCFQLVTSASCWCSADVGARSSTTHRSYPGCLVVVIRNRRCNWWDVFGSRGAHHGFMFYVPRSSS